MPLICRSQLCEKFNLGTGKRIPELPQAPVIFEDEPNGDQSAAQGTAPFIWPSPA